MLHDIYFLPGLLSRFINAHAAAGCLGVESRVIVENIGNYIAVSSLTCSKSCIHFLCYKKRIMNFQNK
jgi:hypothetical protein